MLYAGQNLAGGSVFDKDGGVQTVREAWRSIVQAYFRGLQGWLLSARVASSAVRRSEPGQRGRVRAQGDKKSKGGRYRQNFESPSGNRFLERVGFQQCFATSGSPLREARCFQKPGNPFPEGPEGRTRRKF